MSFPEDPCPWCPVAGRDRGEVCPAQAARHARYCEWARIAVEAEQGTPEHAKAQGFVRLLLGESPAQPTEPGLFTKAVNFGKAIVTHTIAGMPTVDEATYETRLAICQACSFFDAERVVCLKCGCSLGIKLHWSDQECPIGRWGKAGPAAVSPSLADHS